ncbi:unnamed protein product [Polarella glacialis]|uniref:Prolyl endopeptidase n=1 Tax=Polarella glacialis TaxID=89957 RepID=A0A813LRP1_POLGL|nr:unnamed protein product [Polarella glacialis]
MAQLRRVVKDLWRSARSSPAARLSSAPSLRRADGLLQGTPPSAVPSAALRSPVGRFDDWACLQDSEGPAACSLLDAEARSTEAFFAASRSFEERLQTEAAHLLLPEEQAPPEQHGDFLYYQRHTPEGFVVFCRVPREAAGGGLEEVLLDSGLLADEAGTGFAEVTTCKVSDDHSVLAYIVDLHGDESYELRLRGLGPAGSSWPVRLPGVRSVEFLGCRSDDEDTLGIDLLAVHTDPQTKRSCRVSRIRVSANSEGVCESELLWEDENEAAYLEVFRTKDRSFVLLSSNTKDTSEVRAVRCNSTADRSAALALHSASRLLEPREGVEYFAEHRGRDFYVVSNHERADFSVYLLSEDHLGAADGGWSHLVPFFTPPGGVHVTDADMLENWLVLYGHEAAAPRICAVPLESASAEAFVAELPTGVGSVEPGVNAEPSAESIRFTFRSALEAGSTYDLHLASKKVSLVSSREWAPGSGVHSESFTCERVEYPAQDGTLVPLTLARPRSEGFFASDLGPGPCLLHVYGAYGSCLAPDFRPEHIALLRRGWSVAWAHVRGGGERGRAWHAAGRRLEKHHSVSDLADAARFLLSRGIAAPGALCLKGSSAGGLTLGALLNSQDEAALVGAAILEVPFVDALTGMLDSSLPLTVHEYAEWGDPRQPEHEANLRSLSPYENVGSHRYPPLYLSCARADARVPLWMPLKLAARLRARAPAYLQGVSTSGVARRRSKASADHSTEAASQSEPIVVLHCADGGHGGAADWHGRTEEFTRQIAFLYKALGLEMR